MYDKDRFPIPAGLRPLRISRSDVAAAPTVSTLPPASEQVKDHPPKAPATNRDYFLKVARKMGQSRPLRLSPPRGLLGCCLCAPKVKKDRTASVQELSKLLQASLDAQV